MTIKQAKIYFAAFNTPHGDTFLVIYLFDIKQNLRLVFKVRVSRRLRKMSSNTRETTQCTQEMLPKSPF